MSRTGCCYDNAPMESFFHTLKVELVHHLRGRYPEHGRMAWQVTSGYTRRARAETAIARFKRVIGDGLRSGLSQTPE